MVSKNILIGFAVLTVIVVYSFVGFASPGKYDDFASCLSDNDAIMYGTDWCPHCKSQKSMFSKSFKYVNYVNCDLERQKCTENGITGYPTWIISDKQYIGTQSLAVLSQISGCRLQ